MGLEGLALVVVVVMEVSVVDKGGPWGKGSAPTFSTFPSVELRGLSARPPRGLPSAPLTGPPSPCMAWPLSTGTLLEAFTWRPELLLFTGAVSNGHGKEIGSSFWVYAGWGIVNQWIGFTGGGGGGVAPASRFTIFCTVHKLVGTTRGVGSWLGTSRAVICTENRVW